MQTLKTSLLIATAMCFASCVHRSEESSDQSPVTKAEKPFAAGGSVEMQLDGGSYAVKPASGDTIRVSFSGNLGNATADLTTSGTHANIAIKDTPHHNFNATIEVPKSADLAVQLSGGNLEIGSVAGNKDIDSKAGNVEISGLDPKDYSSVDGSVTAGNVEGGPFGDSGSGFKPHVKWSGSGKYTLKAHLGAGNLELKK